MKKALILLLIILFHALPVKSALAGGIQGRAALRGEVVKDVLIYAYKNFDTGLRGEPFKLSEPSKIDGIYKFELPAGRYYFVARKTKSAGIELGEGDLYCYYSGSPIEVTDDSYKNVGFNLIKVDAKAKDKKGGKSGVMGNITFEGELLEKVYLFVYKSAATDFKGPADYVFPSRVGRFKLRLPPGEYYLIARKRKKGGMYGPIEKDDYFNYYYGNPVRVTEGVFVSANIECISRLDMLEEPIQDTEKRGITITAKDEKGAPRQGLYLLVYTDKEMKGRPAYVSERTDLAGKTFLELTKPAKYYLIVRGRLGGPAYEGEYYSRYTQGDSSVTLSKDEMHKELNFTVRKFKPVN